MNRPRWASEADRNVWHRYGAGLDTAECGHEANGEAAEPASCPPDDGLVCGRCHVVPETVDSDELDRECAGRLERMADALRVRSRNRTAAHWTSIGLASSVLRDIVMAGWLYRGAR